ncbi:MAG: hypothetical protein JWM11_2298, partial [Planctomycetaceae bacterium]|nr:hypothetical protein [Planctomycetaceae bacterium]
GTCGGGSQLSDDCGIEFVDIEIQLTDLDRGLEVTRDVLNVQGAPKGSVLRYTENEEEKSLEFGVTECLAVFLDGTGLPDSVYENSDINILAGELIGLLSSPELGEIRGSWCGPKETAIFLYGLDAEQLYTALEPVLNTYPLCQNARIVMRHGNEGLNPRSFRIPMHT